MKSCLTERFQKLLFLKTVDFKFLKAVHAAIISRTLNTFVNWKNLRKELNKLKESTTPYSTFRSLAWRVIRFHGLSLSSMIL